MKKWIVYAIDPAKNLAYEWRRCVTRRGAERAAAEFTLMPIWLVPMDPMIVHADEVEAFGARYDVVPV